MTWNCREFEQIVCQRRRPTGLGPARKKRRGPAIFRSPGLNKAGTDLLSPTWTTIGPKDFTTEFGMGSGVTPQVSAPARPDATSRLHGAE